MARPKKKEPKAPKAKPQVLKLHDPTDAVSLRAGIQDILEALGLDPSTVGAMGGPFNNDGTYHPVGRGTCLGATVMLWKQQPVGIGEAPRRSADEVRVEITIQGAEARTVLLDVRGENHNQEKAVLAAISGSDPVADAPEAVAAPEPAPDLPASDAAAVMAPMPDGDDAED